MILINDKNVFILNNFTVNYIGSSSGVFMGTNHAKGWISQAKSNNGFGRISNGIVLGNTHQILDNDVMDSPTSNKFISVDVENEKRNLLQKNFIHLDAIHNQTMSHNSTVSMGENIQSNWISQMKNNFGQGISVGKIITHKNTNMITDNDQIDSPKLDQDIVIASE